MNKKGFTLVELLATIIVLAVVTVIGTMSVSGIKAKIQANMFDSKLQLIIGTAQTWGTENKDIVYESNCGSTNHCIMVSIDDLVKDGLAVDDKYGNIKDNVGTVINETKIEIQLINNRALACIESSTIASIEASAREIYNNYICK